MPAPPPVRRVPAFSPVPLRARTDGWTALRQADFLGALAETRSVAEAARRVGMARETAYRLRRKAGAESFAAAWDAILGKAADGRVRKVTPEALWQRALVGLLRPVMRGGRHVATVQSPDNTALLRLMRQIGRASPRLAADGRSRERNAASASTSGDGER